MDKKQYERIIEIHKQMDNLDSIKKVVGMMNPSGMHILDSIRNRDVSFYDTDKQFRSDVIDTIYEMVEKEMKRLEDEISNM